MPLPLPRVQAWLEQLFPHAPGPPHLTPLAADASSKRFWRARWSRPQAGLPASCVVMRLEPWEASQPPSFLSVGDHLRASGVRVPQVYGACPPAGLLCLEDFGDRTLAQQWRVASASGRREWGQRAIDELVKLHTAATRRDDPACPALHLAFDVAKFLEELHFFRQHALEGLWQRWLSPAEREAFTAACLPLCTVLAAQPRYFCHRDYHGWNLMATRHGIGVLDFQDARLGPQPYDLMSLLTDRGTPALLGDALLQALVAYYLRRMEAEEGRRIERAAFAELCDLVAVQRGLKAIGTFAYQATARARRHYLAYIPPTLAYVWPRLQRHGLLRPLAAVLRRYLPSA
ncbi:MAG: aminoglycoside phosphotransferase [Candidatus Tectimicrobiota bacterium]|nr:MAG: aminoglycoside phosphotransferase [Candidatus Tectomicrobia bacterium]